MLRRTMFLPPVYNHSTSRIQISNVVSLRTNSGVGVYKSNNNDTFFLFVVLRQRERQQRRCLRSDTLRMADERLQAALDVRMVFSSLAVPYLDREHGRHQVALLDSGDTIAGSINDAHRALAGEFQTEAAPSVMMAQVAARSFATSFASLRR